MTETKEKKGGEKKPLSLSKPGKLSIKKRVERTQVEQKFPHGRRKAVEVEVVKKRTYQRDEGGKMRRISDEAPVEEPAPEVQEEVQAPPRQLTEREREARARALKSVGQDSEAERVQHDVKEARRLEREEAKRREEEEKERRQREEEEAERRREEEERRRAEEARHKADAARLAAKAEALQARDEQGAAPGDADSDRDVKKRRGDTKKPAPSRRSEPRRREGKLTITQALSGDEGRRQRSDAAFRRKQERERKRAAGISDQPAAKVVREVVIPETITVQELANRMAERGAEVVKALMKNGIMATITQDIDGDTAELIVEEFGHTVKRVSEADVEIGLVGGDDPEDKLQPRAPVVTIMGHVDHGKTSLLDALRATDVAAREAGGITQHIGAYKVTLESGAQITFLDTPGHEAFTEMRSRGAKVTDIVVLVVAADDGIQPQTVEAIAHAKAAEVPIIVAINKIDKAGADANRVRQELLQHELVVEEMGGEILDIEVSATEKINLDKLEEAILLQAELLELKANPDRDAEGAIVEAKLEQGRGSVATVLVQRGTLKVGDIFVAGPEWGRVRALLDDHGQQIDAAGPATPVEVLGLQGTPSAGDDFVTVGNETRAREISDYRQRVLKNTNQALGARSTVEQMFSAIEEGETKNLAVVVKADVQGSVEAILASLEKLVADNDELGVRVLHAGVGGINESDVTLAKASNGLVIGFNVRANPQAREAARRDHVDIRYYSVIYDIVDDAKALLSGLLSPVARENMLGTAEIREVFRVSKVGSVAGCMVTDGIVKRGAKVRLLRDDVVIHEGALATLKRFKDDVREVKEGFECGLSLENYQDIKQGDVVECFEVEEVARAL